MAPWKSTHGIEREIEFYELVIEDHDVTRFEVAANQKTESLWQAQKNLAFALEDFDPDLMPLHPWDVSVPTVSYPDIVSYTKRRGGEKDLLSPASGTGGTVTNIAGYSWT